MIHYPNFDPIAFSIGPLDIYWYGISYVLGFIVAYSVSILRGPKVSPKWDSNQISDLLFYLALGIIFGGRIGFILLYQTSALWEKPWTILAFWEQGRSFHGGLLGVLILVYMYSKFHKRRFLEITDFIAPVIPIGIAFGRLGNFVNGELWGRTTSLPWGMVFPYAGPEVRHPSQLYEFLLEGIILFILLLWYSKKLENTAHNSGKISGMFLFAYGLFRTSVEFVREPDFSHGFVLFDFITIGQLLSIPMMLAGLYFIFRNNIFKRV